ncbi:hypothetical protein [Symmachiella dynata]|nr:hypothetical protein [Symmachiella dynata]
MKIYQPDRGQEVSPVKKTRQRHPPEQIVKKLRDTERKLSSG